MRVVLAISLVVLTTIVSAGVPGRDIIRQTTELEPRKESVNTEKTSQEIEETEEEDSIEENDKDSNLHTPHSPKEDVIPINQILGELPDAQEDVKTRSGKFIVTDTPSNSNTNQFHIDTSSTKPDGLYNPSGGYEITENVIDVPDDRTVAGPVIFNYTKFTPLNIGGARNKTESTTPEPAEVEDDKTVRSRVSILHIKAELDEPVKRENKIKTFFNGVKKYITGIKTGVVNGIHKLFGKKEDEAHEKSFGDEDVSDEDASLSDEEDDFHELHKHNDDFSELHKEGDDFGKLHKKIHDDIDGFFN